MAATVIRALVPLGIGPVATVQDKLLELAERHRRAAEVECILDPDLALRLILGESVLVGVGRAHHESARLDSEALEGRAAVEAQRQGLDRRAALGLCVHVDNATGMPVYNDLGTRVRRSCRG
jgi:hypothetical protein